jgi:diacylglycerol kinase (ATP)
MKYTLIINPKSGKGAIRNTISLIKRRFRYYELEIKITKKQGDAITYARKSKSDVVIAAGGDGTVNEVINGIMQKRFSAPRLGVLPLGTSNMVARSLGIQKNLNKAIDTILYNRRKDFDVGRVNDRYFAIACGIGLDAHAYKNVEPKIKKMFGEIAYPISFFKTVFNYKADLLTVKANGQTYKGYYVLVCNIAKFKNLLQIVPDSRDDDGLFDVIILKKRNFPDLLRYVFGLATKQVHKFKDVDSIKTKKLEVLSNKGVIAHADAEIIGKTPVKLKIYEKALEIIC